ncbi:helix-turn-helix domain-containing protein [Polycladidibacter hongkongensis]|uniref:helix-turn-helix domain-containing protein n=1 Tax=Polycladidibacter hongkongensis TaxID=1647556 RepID=UPI00082A74B3|nr:helix-turn-helix domain-containing protein [Pseudovibrio hongkongensis]
MDLLDIGEVVRRSGVKASALRYYEEIGLVRSASRIGLRRQYEPQVLTRLAVITLAKSGGFSLTEIAQMFDASGQLRISRKAMHARADEVETQIQELMALRDMLRHVAECPAPSHLQCPSFVKLLKSAVAQKRAVLSS